MPKIYKKNNRLVQFFKEAVKSRSPEELTDKILQFLKENFKNKNLILLLNNIEKEEITKTQLLDNNEIKRTILTEKEKQDAIDRLEKLESSKSGNPYLNEKGGETSIEIPMLDTTGKAIGSIEVIPEKKI